MQLVTHCWRLRTPWGEELEFATATALRDYLTDEVCARDVPSDTPTRPVLTPAPEPHTGGQLVLAPSSALALTPVEAPSDSSSDPRVACPAPPASWSSPVSSELCRSLLPPPPLAFGPPKEAPQGTETPPTDRPGPSDRPGWVAIGAVLGASFVALVSKGGAHREPMAETAVTPAGAATELTIITEARLAPTSTSTSTSTSTPTSTSTSTATATPTSTPTSTSTAATPRTTAPVSALPTRIPIAMVVAGPLSPRSASVFPATSGTATGAAQTMAAGAKAKAATPDLLKQAALAHDHGNQPRAKALYRAALDQAPDDATALTAMGDIARAEGKNAEASSYYERVLSLTSSTAVTLRLADTLWDLNDKPAARRRYDELLRRAHASTYPKRVLDRAMPF